MADSKNKAARYSDAYNETDTGEQPDQMNLYYDYDEVMGVHLSSADMQSTPNSESGTGIMGSPAPGEPNPAGMTIVKSGK
jgi:hypothetical protein